MQWSKILFYLLKGKFTLFCFYKQYGKVNLLKFCSFSLRHYLLPYSCSTCITLCASNSLTRTCLSPFIKNLSLLTIYLVSTAVRCLTVRWRYQLICIERLVVIVCAVFGCHWGTPGTTCGIVVCTNQPLYDRGISCKFKKKRCSLCKIICNILNEISFIIFNLFISTLQLL